EPSGKWWGLPRGGTRASGRASLWFWAAGPLPRSHAPVGPRGQQSRPRWAVGRSPMKKQRSSPGRKPRQKPKTGRVQAHDLIPPMIDPAEGRAEARLQAKERKRLRQQALEKERAFWPRRSRRRG